MQQYRVVWAIDVDAESPVDAADQAEAILTDQILDLEAFPPAFQVIDSSGCETIVDMSVDDNDEYSL